MTHRRGHDGVIYTGGRGVTAEPEEQQRIMDEWGAWYGKMGAAIVDGGNPFTIAKHIHAVLG